MHGIGPVVILLILWAVITAVWIVLLIYRSVRVTDQSEHLFLDEAEQELEREREEAIQREKRIGTYLYTLGIASVVMLVCTVSVWILRGLGA